MSTQSDPINTAPLQQFISQVKNADAGRQKDIRMDIAQAKRLAFTLGEVMTRLNGDLEALLVRKTSGQDEIIDIQIGTNARF